MRPLIIPKNLLLTGLPGVGKTTAIRKLAARLGERADGFTSEEVRERDERVGFKIVTLDGREGTLARVGLKRGPRLGRFGVNVQDLEGLAVPAVERAIREREVVVVDEIGPMELTSAEFKTVLLEALESPRRVVATICAKPNPFCDRIKRRPDVALFTLTKDNRDSIVDELLRML